MQKLSDALHSPILGRASPDLPSDRPLEVDGGLGDDADGDREDAVPGASARGLDE